MQIEALQIAKQNAIINSLLNHQKTSDSLITVALNCCATGGATHKTTQNNNNETTQEIKLTLPDAALMGDVRPNPNSGSAEIDYYLPSSVTSAQIIFTDILGKLINQTKLANGYGTIAVDTQDLPSGAYTYSLIIDGKIFDTKKMVRTK